MGISVAMIVKNEEQNIERAIRSAWPSASEIIVVDTGSTDHTKEIANDLGATVYDFEWTNSFSDARNFSIDKCDHPWVLILDADEELFMRDHGLIWNAPYMECGAFYSPLRNYFLDGNQATVDVACVQNTDANYPLTHKYPYYAELKVIRMFRNDGNIRFTGRIHELLDTSIREHDIKVGDAQFVIHHHGKAMLDREQAKRQPYLDMTQAEAYENPDNPQLWFNYVMQAAAANRYDLALEGGLKYLEIEKGGPSFIWMAVGMGFLSKGMANRALHAFDTVLAVQPTHTTVLNRRAVALGMLGRTEEARKGFLMAIRSNPGFITSYVNLAELESHIGNRQGASRAIRMGLSVAPSDPVLLRSALVFGS